MTRCIPLLLFAMQGLIAISQLLKSSIDRGYTGSKLRLVEVVSDGIGAAQEKW
jgi:hypothetical protein